MVTPTRTAPRIFSRTGRNRSETLSTVIKYWEESFLKQEEVTDEPPQSYSPGSRIARETGFGELCSGSKVEGGANLRCFCLAGPVLVVAS